MNSKVKDLVVDTGAFLRNAPLQNYGDNIYTCEDVLAEVKSKWAKERLQVLPYEIKIKEPNDEDIKFAASFAKKTGDYFSLSATDLRVIALSIRLERERNGNLDHLKTTPSSTKIVSNVPKKQISSNNDYGFNFKKNLDKKLKLDNKNDNNLIKEEDDDKKKEKNLIKEENNLDDNKINNNNILEGNDLDNSEGDSSDYKSDDNDEIDDDNEEYYSGNELDSDLERELNEKEDFNNYYSNLIKTKGNLDELKENQQQNQTEDDDGDWITPSNINLVKKQFDNLKLDEKQLPETEIYTACITGDYSIQNVLMQLGIKVLSAEKGLLIRRTRQFVLRCIACFTITKNTSLIFCPSCGNLKTLKKVSVSVDENGQKRIHLNPNRPITTRDVKLRIPRPRKGKYALNPILAPDQHVPKFKQAKSSIEERKSVRNSILSEAEYVIRDNPFSYNDIYSKSSRYKTGNRAAAINKMVFNEGRKYANKRKSKKRN